MQETIPLEIADPRAAIRYLGEMQSRPMDPIHEPIQNLLDEGARRIDLELDARKRRIRIRGNARPIASICSSRKVAKLGEKGVGMLSFVNVGESMTTLSQKGGRVVWFTLYRDRLAEGQVGRDRGNRLPYAGTEVCIKGVSRKSLKYRFAVDRVIKDNQGLAHSLVVNRHEDARFRPASASWEHPDYVELLKAGPTARCCGEETCALGADCTAHSPKRRIAVCRSAAGRRPVRCIGLLGSLLRQTLKNRVRVAMGSKPVDQFVVAHVGGFRAEPVSSLAHVLNTIECL